MSGGVPGCDQTWWWKERPADLLANRGLRKSVAGMEGAESKSTKNYRRESLCSSVCCVAFQPAGSVALTPASSDGSAGMRNRCPWDRNLMTVLVESGKREQRNLDLMQIYQLLCWLLFFNLVFTSLLMFTRPFWLRLTFADVWFLAVTYIINKQDKYTPRHSDISGVIRYFSSRSSERQSQSAKE